ncbi:MAG: hypothetical protein B7Z66_09555 [Chromatiales bacterium 21-64-14]|nr:MAG: hypothetical protein B7Z66_09555 [Chromatiales bacterium 21-64-14]HQU16330.1 SCO family protein [Gammaproteobacteria bacterium]
MKTRRAFLLSCATAVPAIATAATAAKTLEDRPAIRTCPRATGGPNAKRFPQVLVRDQFKEQAWFYQELIENKIALVSFASAKGDAYYPIISNLVKVQDMLKDRLGKDVFMYTVTTNPYQDTPETLKKLADQHGANWRFLSGDPDSIRQILDAFYVRGTIDGLMWIGNERIGRWASIPSRQHPLFIAEVVARLSTGKHYKPFLVDMHSV